jgi:ABC-2 type transport system ATP-binding protein
MPVLLASNLHKSFGSGDKRVDAVQNVSLAIDAGEILAFLGPNGAGKTTTIKIIAGLIAPDSGSVDVLGSNPLNTPSIFQEIGSVFEGSRNVYFELSAQTNLEYFGALKGMSTKIARQRAIALLEEFGLAHKAKEQVQKLSRGMQQKVAIAVALMHRPKLLLLDEPTNGVDIEAAETIKDLLKNLAQNGHAILLTTHQLEVAEALSHRVAIINNGSIIAEDATTRLIEAFSGDTYTIDYGGELSAEKVKQLQDSGCTVTPKQIIYSGDNLGLYNVIALIHPNPLLKIEQDNANLTNVFMRLVKGNKPEPKSAQE